MPTASRNLSRLVAEVFDLREERFVLALWRGDDLKFKAHKARIFRHQFDSPVDHSLPDGLVIADCSFM